MYQRDKDLLLTVRQNLSAFFGNSTLLAELRKNADFRATAKKQIAVCRYLESLPDPTETDPEKKAFKLAAKYADNYRRVTGEDPGDDKPASTDPDDLKDEVGYVGVMVKNLFGKKIEDFPIDAPNDVNLDGGNRPVVADQADKAKLEADKNGPKKVEEKPETPLRGERVGGGAAFGAGAYGGAGFPGFGGMDNPFAAMMGLTPERMALETARARLQNDISTGKFYRYTHKYKAIPMMQMAAAAMALLFALCSLALIIAWIAAVGMGVQTNQTITTIGNDGVPVSKTMLAPLSGGWVLTAIIGPLMSIIFSLMVAWRFYRASIGRGTVRMERFAGGGPGSGGNDNLRYHFVGFPGSAIAMIILYVVLSLLNWAGYAPLIFVNNVDAFYFHGAQGTSSPIMMAVYAIAILYLVAIVPYIIVAGVGMSMNPKNDNERIEKTLAQYADEIRSGQWRPGMDGTEY